MATAIFCASKVSLLQHWGEILSDFTIYIAKNKEELFGFLDTYEKPLVLIIQSNIFNKEDEEFLATLRDQYPHVKVCVLSSKPSIKEGQNFLKLGVKGYGNTYMSKAYLQSMATAIWNNMWWFYPDFVENFFQKEIFFSPKKHQATMKSISHMAIIRDSNEERIAQEGEEIKENEILISPYEDSKVLLSFTDDTIEINGIDTLLLEKSVFGDSGFEKEGVLDKNKIQYILEFLGEENPHFAEKKSIFKNPTAKEVQKIYFKGFLNEYKIFKSKALKDHFIVNDTISQRDKGTLIDNTITLLVFKDGEKNVDQIGTIT